jgi:multidrug efflux system membrane fusion protein
VASGVTVTSMVAGALSRVLFHEGDYVAFGQPLFEIDQRPFADALRQAEAVAARDEASLEFAAAEARRYQRLLDKKLVSVEDRDQRTSAAASLEATVKASRALASLARTNLSYTRIASPVEGRTGALLVDAGNLVKANDTALTTVRRLKPIYVTFSVPGERLHEIRDAMLRGPLATAAWPTGAPRGALGELRFIDNAVDTTTGTIALKARFANDDLALWPGAFARVRLQVGELRDAVVVPARAVVPSQRGDLAYVVDEARRARARIVRLGPRLGELVAVLDGLADGERVVTEGQLGLVDGAPVRLVGSPDGGAP